MKQYRGELEHIVYNKQIMITIDDQEFIRSLLNLEEDNVTYKLQIELIFILYQIEFKNWMINNSKILLDDEYISLDKTQLLQLYTYLYINKYEVIDKSFFELECIVDYQMYSIYK